MTGYDKSRRDYALAEMFEETGVDQVMPAKSAAQSAAQGPRAGVVQEDGGRRRVIPQPSNGAFAKSRLIGAALLMPLLAGASAAQGQGPLYGDWCNDLGDPVLYIEADGLGIGEHRLCRWDKVPGHGAQHQTRVHCQQMSSGGSNPVMISEKSYDFSAVIISPGVLKARIGDGATVMTFTYSPCNS